MSGALAGAVGRYLSSLHPGLGADATLVAAVGTGSQVLRVSRGESVCAAGTHRRGCYWLLAGKVKIGDRATFATSFARLGPSLRGKALDDRIGVVTLIELVQHAPAHIDLQAAFTVQEENGLRGARVASYAFDPDLAIVLDSTPAYDQPNWDDSENTRYNTRLDCGPAIYVADGATLSDPRLVQLLVQTAESQGIPYQIRQPGIGGTDAGVIHKQRAGIPSVSVSVPGRYHHSPAALVRLSDWQHTLTLVAAALLRLQPDFLTSQERP